MPYERILVPFDGSKFSNRALNEAIQIAQMTDGIIYLCTVISISNIVPPGSLLGLVKDASTGELQRRLMKSAKIQAEQLEQSQISYCKSKGVNAYYKIIVNGNVAEEILKVAKKKKADLIVIGSQGLHGVGKIRSLGSVSRKVSELASCPVLIVR
jgi:nucleotide-binding universal stress UspA family protein